MLTKLDRNLIYEAIAHSNLDPAECVYEEHVGHDVISHESGSVIEINIVPMKPRPDYIFTFQVMDGTAGPILHLASMDAAIPHIQKWANEVALVSKAPDFWAEIRRSRELAVDIQRADTNNTPFTKDEQRQIVVELEAIKHYVKEQLQLTNEQKAHIDESLDEIAVASERVSRKDWRLLAYGTVVNMVVNDVVTPDVARHIFIMLVQGIAHLIGGGGPPQILS